MPASAAPVVAVASEMGWYSARSASERAAAVGESPYSQSAVELGSLFVGGTAASSVAWPWSVGCPRVMQRDQLEVR